MEVKLCDDARNLPVDLEPAVTAPELYLELLCFCMKLFELLKYFSFI